MSDGLFSSVFLFYLSGYLTCCSLTHRQADFCIIFCSVFDFFDIFASRQGAFCAFTFPCLFRRNDISGGPCRGAPTGVSPPRLALSFKNKNKKQICDFHECEILQRADLEIRSGLHDDPSAGYPEVRKVVLRRHKRRSPAS